MVYGVIRASPALSFSRRCHHSERPVFDSRRRRSYRGAAVPRYACYRHAASFLMQTRAHTVAHRCPCLPAMPVRRESPLPFFAIRFHLPLPSAFRDTLRQTAPFPFAALRATAMRSDKILAIAVLLCSPSSFRSAARPGGGASPLACAFPPRTTDRYRSRSVFPPSAAFDCRERAPHAMPSKRPPVTDAVASRQCSVIAVDATMKRDIPERRQRREAICAKRDASARRDIAPRRRPVATVRPLRFTYAIRINVLYLPVFRESRVAVQHMMVAQESSGCPPPCLSPPIFFPAAARQREA